MSGTGTVIAIVSLLGAILLAASGLRSHRFSGARGLKMAAIWATIIAVLALGLSFSGV